MANLEKYSFNNYSTVYARLFSREKTKIRKVLPQARIEHVGSTAIPGLGGKGIIDIAIRITKAKIAQFTNALASLGYHQTSDHPPNDKRVFLQKITKYKGKERRVHIHLVLKEDFWNSFIVVRNYLRTHDKERDEYARIKKKAMQYARGEGKKYRDYKNAFLENILKISLDMNRKLIELYEKVQKVPYQVCKYDAETITRTLRKGDCRHKHYLLKKLLEEEGFEVKELKIVFDWKDLPIPADILAILKAGTLWDHGALAVKVNNKWIKVDCSWNPELSKKGFPVTKHWDGKTDTKQVTEGKLTFFDKTTYTRDTHKIKISKEEAHKFAEALNMFLRS